MDNVMNDGIWNQGDRTSIHAFMCLKNVCK